MIFEIAIVEDQATASETLTDHLTLGKRTQGSDFLPRIFFRRGTF